ncbi:M20/M25/M40 family metallo-hydrolase [Gracilibacillus massiliensis]|uniref:M20/M25/M40 family metallo-hydrolase n=1 Tax=Gracilibacillus massiliensis TaxID=1564956 RepID=UPI00071C73AF|nr:M20/M25/M40 family metallo-hydrolase [Gracilibacillus massiliensis]
MKKVDNLLIRHGLEKDDLALSNDYATIAKLIVAKEVQNDHEIMEMMEETRTHVKMHGKESSVNPHIHALPLIEIDRYVRGITRWLNELGIHTTMSCDGHHQRPANISLERPLTYKQKEMLQNLLPSSLKIMLTGRKMRIHYQIIEDLLDFAEKLYHVYQDPACLDYYAAQTLKQSLLEVLSINGESGNEQKIRKYLKHKLGPRMDDVYRDRAGNLLAYRYCGDGPTILLSAHMDTVAPFVDGREIVEEGTTLTSSAGILGADDRAGIAIILEVLRKLERTNFRGTIKVAFTVKEEIDCVGSHQIDQRFIDDVDAAIVVDRRHLRDIVTSFAGIESFCPTAFGQLFEEAAKKLGMPDWSITEGGSSDARNYAAFGIPTVNLSAGYLHEHTHEEIVNYLASYETSKLILKMLSDGEVRCITDEKKMLHSF